MSDSNGRVGGESEERAPYVPDPPSYPLAPYGDLPPPYAQPARKNRTPLLVAGIVSLVLVVSTLVSLAYAGFLVRDTFEKLTPGNPVPSPATNLKAEPKVGALAPDFTLRDVGTGREVSLSDLRGKPVWINFWATWCPPCREEMPEMQTLYEQHRDTGLVIVGVDVQESEDTVSKFTKEVGATWPSLLDPDGDIVDRYFVSALPSHFFVDREGVIRAIHIGGLKTMGGRRAPVDEYLEKILEP